MNKAGIKKLICKGEGISMEFKECRNKLNKDIFESICAFLNRNGGDLLLGVNDKGKITGIAPEAVEQVKKELVTALNNPLSPEHAAIRAGRLMLERIHFLADRGTDFGFETTLSGKGYVRLLKDLKKPGLQSLPLFPLD